MPQKNLRILANSASFEAAREAARSLPDLVPTIDLGPFCGSERTERIIVYPAGSYAEQLAEQWSCTTSHPVTFVDSTQDLKSATKAIFKALKVPNVPVFVDELLWFRIRRCFWYLQPSDIRFWAFPKDIIRRFIRERVGPEFRDFFGDGWLDSLCDARGRIIPNMAWRATKLLGETDSRLYYRGSSIATAASEWLSSAPTFQHFLTHMPVVVPDDNKLVSRNDPLQISTHRVLSRLLRATRVTKLATPYDTKTSWMQAAEVVGIWRIRPQGKCLFSPAYAAGYALMKQKRLTRLS